MTDNKLESIDIDNNNLLDFKDTFINFIKCCKIILDKKTINDSKSTQYINIEKYLKIITNEKLNNKDNIKLYFHDSIVYFFNKYKGDLLSGIEDDDNWLLKNNITLVYGEHIKDLKVPTDTIINISNIYRDAKIIVNSNKKNLLITTNDKIDINIELVYYLYQLIYKTDSLSKQNKRTVLSILSDLENTYDIKPKIYYKSNMNNGIGGNGGINSIVNIALNVAKTMGLEGNPEDVNNMLANIDNNPMIMDTIKGISESIGTIGKSINNGNSDISDIVTLATSEVRKFIPTDQGDLAEAIDKVGDMAKNINNDKVREILSNASSHPDQIEAANDIMRGMGLTKDNTKDID